jgi:hypothetical protein
MNPIREKLERLNPIEVGQQKAQLYAEAVALLADWEAQYQAATEREDMAERRRLFPLISSLKADIKRRLTV